MSVVISKSNTTFDTTHLSWNQAVWLIWSALNGNWNLMDMAATEVLLHSGESGALGWIISDGLLVTIRQSFFWLLVEIILVCIGILFYVCLHFSFQRRQNNFGQINNEKKENKRYRQCHNSRYIN